MSCNHVSLSQERKKYMSYDYNVIHIWEDKWLPTPSTYKVITPLKPINDFPMLSSLIDYETKRWKSE